MPYLKGVQAVMKKIDLFLKNGLTEENEAMLERRKNMKLHRKPGILHNCMCIMASVAGS